MGHAVVHWELMSKAPEKAAAFYAKLFGLFTDPDGRMRGLLQGADR